MKILWKYSERYVVKQSASDKRVITWPPDKLWTWFLVRLCLIVKVKSQKVWSRLVDFCGDGEEKTWRRGGVDSTRAPRLK